ncbi:hypothetical protein CMQ_3382 [Grosmannia clavigera kw1407]|uniref:Chitin synthesis regulation, Congo red resistance, RCR protein n=1 Tax=Grosmannia clavigera (strain kw1407 / UAMH 11150) TaxID=655863 RepID=F0X9G1_GROCL|nr:uncharacterized protein CMQ_3382 [Grosmannia clavigera kw1407]EFX05313.1 hypothetical protein CMQ_3382 [Grosmannia clavigera kw1407]
MAPMAQNNVKSLLSRRYYCYDDGTCYNYSGWHWWGRWVFLGLIILFFLALFLLLCVRNRRRRTQGNAPMYGTGWMGNWGHPQYPPPQYSQQPPVGAQYTGGTYNSNQGYYANSDVPLQQPSHSYAPTRGDAGDDYAPPSGPPPRKN